ncbi:MAG: hypothetical protein JWP44_1192 [Mucilaginibacter sp.]|nr:hypothetical protein [Mucilaginibacter sp.]
MSENKCIKNVSSNCVTFKVFKAKSYSSGIKKTKNLIKLFINLR